MTKEEFITDLENYLGRKGIRFPVKYWTMLDSVIQQAISDHEAEKKLMKEIISQIDGLGNMKPNEPMSESEGGYGRCLKDVLKILRQHQFIAPFQEGIEK